MRSSLPPPDWWPRFFGLAFCILYPSIALFKKIGYGMLAAYFISGGVALGGIILLAGPRLSRILSKPVVYRTTGAGLLIGLMAAHLIIHPAIDEDDFSLFGKLFGASDGDDAIELAINELRAGHYPYYAKTFLGNPITPMPGALLLAFPFYLLGNATLQNLFWLAVFFILVAWHYRSPAAGIFLAGATLFLSPNVAYQVFTGSDYIANGIYVLVFTYGLMTALQRNPSGRAARWWAILLGIGLASRPNFILITPLVFIAVWRLTSWKMTIRLSALSIGALALVTLPFFLHDPQGFSPLHTSAKLNIGGKYPWAPLVIPVLGALLALALGLRYRSAPKAGKIIQDIFLVQAAVILSGGVIASIAAGMLNLEYPHFAALFMFYGIFAFGAPCLFISGRFSEPEPVQDGCAP